eukprot:UN01040
MLPTMTWDCTVCELRNSNASTICRACFNIKVEPKLPNELQREEKEFRKEKESCINNIGVGDCELYYNVLPSDMDFKNYAFYKLKNEVKWHSMKHKGGPVPRLVANQGIIYQSNNNIQFEPIYRHPATEQPKLIQFTPFVDYIRKICEKHVAHILNHALIQLYRNGNDYIGDHSDKTIDINPDSKIVDFSVGATREMLLKKKKKQNLMLE